MFAIPSNYVVPYSFSAIYAVTFYVSFLFFLIKYHKEERVLWLILGGASLGLCAITKLEFAAASILTILAIATLKFFADVRRGDYRFCGYRILAFILPTGLIFFGFFVWPFKFSEALHSFLRESRLDYSVESSWGRAAIWNYIAANIVKEAAVVGMIIIGIFCYKKFELGRRINRSLKSLLFLVLVAFVSYYSYLEIISQKKTLLEKYHWGWMVTTIPLLFGALAVLLSRWFASFKKKEDLSWRSSAYLTIVISGLALNLRHIGMGFTGYAPILYAVPLIFWVLFFLKILPEKMQVLRKDISPALEKVFVFIFIAYSLYLFALSGWNFRKEYVYKLTYPRGVVITDAHTGPLFDSIVRQIEKDVKPDEKFFTATIPASGLFYFLSERENVLRYNELHYSTCPLIEGDLPSFGSKKINYILIDNLMSSYLYMPDMAACDKFISWVKQNYSLEKSFITVGPKKHFFEYYDLGWYKIKASKGGQ